MNLNIAVLEDNPIDFQTLSDLLYRWAESCNHMLKIKYFAKSADILSHASINNYDILFSDIEINDSVNGIDTCRSLRKNGFKGDIIFLTAFKEYVFDGYAVQASNYLLKPVTFCDLKKCMDIISSMHHSDYYYLNRDNCITRIPFNDIISINRSGHDCIINTSSGLYAKRASLNDFEKELPVHFIRCHKSCIVNLNHIISLSGSTLKLSNRLSQSVGRSYLEAVRLALLKIAGLNP